VKSRLLRHPWRKERGAILLFCPGHHTKLDRNNWTHKKANRGPISALAVAVYYSCSTGALVGLIGNATAHTPQSQISHNTSAHRTRRTGVRRPGLRLHAQPAIFITLNYQARLSRGSGNRNRAPSGRLRSLPGRWPGVTGGRGLISYRAAGPGGCSRLSLAEDSP
jgi:hypothetical protein